MEKKIIYYSEFGAVGDGKAADFEAIKRCHEYANENGCKVMADAGKTYYIGDTGPEAIKVKTDVDWTGATFIIDDAIIPPENPTRNAHLFVTVSDYAMIRYDEDSEAVRKINENGGIKADEATNIGYAPGYTALLILYNNEHSAYIRAGCHATGKPNPLRELVVVDALGNIDPNTKFLLDFNHVSYIEEYRCDDEPITLVGGKFITRANAAEPRYTAYNRGICFQRSNCKIKDTVHEIVDEGAHGAPYSGFIYYYKINGLTCENLTLMSHKSYKDYEYDENGKVIKVHSTMGSYDIGGNSATNITFKNCNQSNYWKYEPWRIAYNEQERWGIMGTNYCKNMTYDGCTFSRLDAHAGVYNVTIKDTLISIINLTGGGVARIEGSKIVAPEGHDKSLFTLRSDYGSTWKGDVIIRDCEFINWKAKNAYIASAIWQNWDFGYITYLPKVTIDNLKLDKAVENVYIFNDLTHGHTNQTIDLETVDGAENKNPMRIDTTVVIKNNNGYNFVGCENPYISEKIRMIEE